MKKIIFVSFIAMCVFSLNSNAKLGNSSSQSLFIPKAELKIQFERIDTWDIAPASTFVNDKGQTVPVKGQLVTKMDTTDSMIKKFELNIENNSQKMVNLIKMKDFDSNSDSLDSDLELNVFSHAGAKRKNPSAIFNQDMISKARIRADRKGNITSATIRSSDFENMARAEFLDYMFHMMEGWENKLVSGEFFLNSTIEELKLRASSYRCNVLTADTLVCKTKIKAEMTFIPNMDN
jgi:hypothetical protein